jgi:hypothetical protein
MARLLLSGETVSVREEFVTVDLVLDSGTRSRGVDAFALALIKSERQLRRLFTYLVYQFPWCGRSEAPALRRTLARNRYVYFAELKAGWNALYPVGIAQLVGDEYARLSQRLDEARQHRNKIFHGQVTPDGLRRADLQTFVTDIRAWCERLGSGALHEVGFTGFGQNSFHKGPAGMSDRYRVQIANMAGYQGFIDEHMSPRGAQTRRRGEASGRGLQTDDA